MNIYKYNYNNKKREYEELCKGEEEIKKSLTKYNSFEYGYKQYALLDRDWYIKYKKYLSNYLFNHLTEKFSYNVKSMYPKMEEKKYFFFQMIILLIIFQVILY